MEVWICRDSKNTKNEMQYTIFPKSANLVLTHGIWGDDGKTIPYLIILRIDKAKELGIKVNYGEKISGKLELSLIQE
jgi:hypothetical protein